MYRTETRSSLTVFHVMFFMLLCIMCFLIYQSLEYQKLFKDIYNQEAVLNVQIHNLEQEMQRQEKINKEQAKVIKNLQENTYQYPINTSTHKTSRKTSNRGNTRSNVMLATFYTQYDPGCNTIASNGEEIIPRRTIAVPETIPLGIEVYLEFPKCPELNGYYRTNDRGGSIVGNRIDVCVATRNEAFGYGRQEVRMYL